MRAFSHPYFSLYRQNRSRIFQYKGSVEDGKIRIIESSFFGIFYAVRI